MVARRNYTYRKKTVRQPAAGPAMVVVGLSLFLSGFCGILAELALFNLAEILLGGTNANLTFTMGVMMFAMGMGAALTAARWFPKASVELFILVEILLSLVSMGSVVVIYLLSGLYPGTALLWIGIISPLIGVLVGLEIPLVLRVNESLGLGLKVNAPLVMAPDYFGALAAFVAFTFWLLPEMGLAHAAWLGGLFNLVVAGLVAWVFRGLVTRRALVASAVVGLAIAAAGSGWFLKGWMDYAEQLHYRGAILAAETTPYQRIVITDEGLQGSTTYGKGKPKTKLIAHAGNVEVKAVSSSKLCPEDIRLFISGGLQFSTCDEYRYHEMLVHPSMFLNLSGSQDQQKIVNVLVLGGGDGMAVREVLKYRNSRVRLVELDEAMVLLFRDDVTLSRFNGNALSNNRVTVTVGDAFRFLRETNEKFDVVVMDFPDPHKTQTALLYSTQFFQAASRVLASGGVLVTQSFSPLFQRKAFLMVRKTMEASGLGVVSLQVPMLTFEHWGFHIASRELSAEVIRQRLEGFSESVSTRFLNQSAVQSAIRWYKGDMEGYDALPINDQFTLPLAEVYRRALRRPGQ